MSLKIGSLFSGYGGLDLAAESFFGATTAWHVEFDKAPSKILAHHWPNVPNYGDVTTVDWANVEPVDILTGGFPCQDLSLAGRRQGMRPGTRSGLWADFVKAIDALQPAVVVIENVRGLLSGCAESDLGLCEGCVGDGEHRPVLRALGRVLGDLADLGFDAEWAGIRASDVGAPHGRFRVFVLAYRPGIGREWAGIARDGRRRPADGGVAAVSTLLPTPEQSDASGGRVSSEMGGKRPSGAKRAITLATAVHHKLMPTPVTSDGTGAPRNEGTPNPQSFALQMRDIAPDLDRTDFGQYEPAVRRWESITRPAPAPTLADGRDGNHRLNAAFAEWMMGVPDQWITDPEIGITRREQLKACGNGVVPQQAEAALAGLWERATA